MIRSICLALLVSLFLYIGIGAAQEDPAEGVPPFTTNEHGVDLASSNINIAIPVRTKLGLSARLVGNSHAYMYLPPGKTQEQIGVSFGFKLMLGSLLDAQLEWRAAYEPGVCHGQDDTFYSNFVIVDAQGVHQTNLPTISSLGCVHPTSATGASVDNTGYTLNAVATRSAGPAITVWDASGNSAQAWTGDGSSPATISSVQDPDGNIVADNAGTYIDSLQTTFLTAHLGSGGSADTYSWTDAGGNTQQIAVNYSPKTMQTNFACSGVSDISAVNNVYFPTSISLPDGSRYTLSYEPTPGNPANVTGRIVQINYPTGGYVAYAYSGGNQGFNCTSQVVPTLTVTANDSAHSAQWSYVNTAAGSPWGDMGNFTVTKTDPALNQAVYNFADRFQTQAAYYQGQATGTPLKTVMTCYNNNFTNCPAPSNAPILPITKADVYTNFNSANALAGNLVETQYDSYGNVIDLIKGDWGQAIKSQTYAYYGQSWNGSSCNAYASGNIRNTPCYSNTHDVVSGNDVSRTQTAYSNTGHPTSVSEWVGGSSWMTSYATYASNGTVQTTTDVNGAATAYSYDGTGGCNNILATSAKVTGTGLPSGGLTTSTTWDCNGGVATSTTDANGQSTFSSFTANGADPFYRIKSTTDPLENTTYFRYTPTSQESYLDFGTNSTVDVLTTVDGLGRPIISQKRQAQGSSNFDTTSTTYDSDGRAAAVSMPCVQTASQPCPGTPATTTTYDGLNRPILITDGGGGTTNYSYSLNDTLQTVGPEHPSSRQMEYDGLGRLSSVCEVTSGTGSGACSQSSQQTGYWTRYSYDALGNLTGVTQNAQGSPQETRGYVYDGLSRLTSETNPETGNTTYTYDSVNTGVCVVNNPGDLVLKTNPATGVSACYVSDALHRVLSIGHNPGLADNTPDKYFVYDSATVNNVVMANAKGHLAEAYTCVTAAPCAKVTDIGFVYSQRGENTEIWESTSHSGGYYHPTAAYWANGALNNLWMSGLPSISFGAEGEGRTSTVSATSGQNPVTGVTYVTSGTTQPIGALTQVTFGSGDSDSFSYDTNTGRMKQYTYIINGRGEVGSLGWNANSTLATLGISDPFNAGDAQNCSYAYDDLARLQSVNCPSVWAQSFNYDAFGNASKSGNSSWLPIYNTKNQYQSIPGFSNPGPTYDANGDVLTDSFHSYTWDADGHVLAIDSTGLTYDALGRMTEQDQSGTYFQIVYSPMGSKLAIMKGQTIQQAFVPLPGGATAEYLSWGLSYYRHPDWLGSERLESSTSHSILQDTAYAPFGEPYAELSGGNGDLSFAGLNKDTDWLNYDALYREYDPRQSRWISPDPSGSSAVDPTNPQSWNRYGYALNNPLNNIDPLGLFCVWDDGTYDDPNDPQTGIQSACSDAGGTWFNGTPQNWDPNAGDWSDQQSAEFAGWAQGINPTVGDFGNPSGTPDASVPGLFSLVPTIASRLTNQIRNGSSLTFNRDSGMLTLYGNDGTVLAVCPAANKTTRGSNGPWPNGTYPFSGHNDHPTDPNGPYGSYGIDLFDVPGRTGMGVHSGRANSGGPNHPTLGCVRTTDGCMQQITEWQASEPMTCITIQ